MKYRGIAISGKAAAGKDVVGEALLNHLHMQFSPGAIVKLAKPIYDEAIAEHGMDPSNKNRALLQSIGDIHTRQEPTYYPRLLIQSIDEANERMLEEYKSGRLMVYQPMVPIVTDLRKTIEAEYLRQKNFALVRLDVDDFIQRQRLTERDGSYVEATLDHWTETDLDLYGRFDVRLPNNGQFSPSSLAYIILQVLGLELSPGGE